MSALITCSLGIDIAKLKLDTALMNAKSKCRLTCGHQRLAGQLGQPAARQGLGLKLVAT